MNHQPHCGLIHLPPVQDGPAPRPCTIADAACCGIFDMGDKKTETETTDARTAASEGSIGVGQYGQNFSGITFGNGGGRQNQIPAWVWIAVAAAGVLILFKLLFPKRWAF